MAARSLSHQTLMFLALKNHTRFRAWKPPGTGSLVTAGRVRMSSILKCAFVSPLSSAQCSPFIHGTWAKDPTGVIMFPHKGWMLPLTATPGP